MLIMCIQAPESTIGSLSTGLTFEAVAHIGIGLKTAASLSKKVPGILRNGRAKFPAAFLALSSSHFSFYARRCEEDHNSNGSGHRCEWSDTDASHRACRPHAHLGLASLSACEEARKRESSELDRGNEAEESGKLGSLSSNECALGQRSFLTFP